MSKITLLLQTGFQEWLDIELAGSEDSDHYKLMLTQGQDNCPCDTFIELLTKDELLTLANFIIRTSTQEKSK